MSSGPWLYRADRATTTEELPWTRVAITPDANGDGAVDWQDGAIAMRDIRVAPFKGDETPDNVVTHIPFNFASQATDPSLRTSRPPPARLPCLRPTASARSRC